MHVLLVNPLPSALGHYESALRRTLRDAGVTAEVSGATSVEVDGGRWQRIARLARLLWERARFRTTADAVVVLWPAIGFLDVFTWILASRRVNIVIVVHDPTPLRRQVGLSAHSRRLAKSLVKRSRVTLVFHTRLAADVFSTDQRETPTLRHPVVASEAPGRSDGALRVLGQYKPARDLAAIERLAAAPPPLQILGRGWPRLAGWDVSDRYLEEDELHRALETARAVAIPYTAFFQSGIAARAFELGVPVVARPHEHIQEMYGDDWPGLVVADDWLSAEARAAAVDRELILRRARAYAQLAGREWELFLRSLRHGGGK